MLSTKRKSLWKNQLTLPKISFYLSFHGFHIFLFIYGWYLQAHTPELAALNTLHFSVWFSRGAGLCLSADATFILLPMCRNLLRIIRPKIRWFPLDESQFFHRQVAYTMLFWTAVHTASHYVNFFNIERSQIRPDAAVQIHYTQAAGITGHVMLFCMLLIYTTAHAKIRQQSYETFWYAHHLFVPFFLALYTHATGCFVRDSANPISPFAGKEYSDHCRPYGGWRWEIIAGGIYILERVYRELNSRRRTEIIKVVRHPYEAVEIQFRKPSMNYKAGQWVLINVPSVATNEWHPFTITSCPFDPYISIHIRQVGDFTRALASALGAGQEQSELYDNLDPLGMYEVALSQGQNMPELRVDGPYGAPAEDVFENEVAVLVGTGIGVTPWAAVLKSIWHMRLSTNPPKRLKRVEFIWICKDTSSFEWFQALLQSLEAQSLEMSGAEGVNNANSFLRIHTYLTQQVDIDTAQNIVLHSVGADKDPLTELSSRTNFGRPNFRRLFTGMREGILDQSYITGLDKPMTEKTDVGVYFCGPTIAARDIRKACRIATTREVRFKFWKEHY